MKEFGLPVAQSPHIESALAAPVVRAARQVRERGGLLREAGTQPAVPTALAAHIPPHGERLGLVPSYMTRWMPARIDRRAGAEGRRAITAVITVVEHGTGIRGSVRSCRLLVTY
jgi:hypothetical protein